MCDLLELNETIIIYKMSNLPSNTLLFNIKGLSPSMVAKELDKREIYVRSGFHCSPLAHKKLKTGDGGAVRAGVGVFNTQREIYSFYEALCDIIKKNK